MRQNKKQKLFKKKLYVIHSLMPKYSNCAYILLAKCDAFFFGTFCVHFAERFAKQNARKMFSKMYKNQVFSRKTNVWYQPQLVVCTLCETFSIVLETIGANAFWNILQSKMHALVAEAPSISRRQWFRNCSKD